MTLLALSEMPRTSQAGAAIYSALLQSPENANDRWIPDAATAAAATHDAGFIKAVLAASGGVMSTPAIGQHGPSTCSPIASFEERAGDQPAGWQVRNVLRPGRASLGERGTHRPTAASKFNRQTGATQVGLPSVSVKPNTNYRLSAWIKTQDVQDGRASVRC